MINVLSLCISHDSIDSQNFNHHPHLPFGAKLAAGAVVVVEHCPSSMGSSSLQ